MMASRGMVAIVYAFIALAVCPVIFSAPASQTCGIQCTPGSVLKYEQGKTYIYNFETEVVTQLVGSTDESSRIKVKGQAAIAAESACDLVLTVQQVAITSSSGQAISRVSDIEGSSIRFGYTDGVITGVCVSDDDPSWSANIKRAIVSLLGNRALTGDTETVETDVNGKCKTTYEVSGTKYTKTKDLQGCSNRDGGMANAFGVPYSNPSQYHSIPLFHSILSCTQELGKGVIQNVECTEGHSLDVVQSSGVRTDIKSSLVLANVQPGITKGSHNPNKKSCLLYDFGEVDDAQRQKAAALNAVDLLNKLCTEIESGTVSLKVPGLFLQLRKQVRHSRKEDLKHVDGEITSGKLCPKAKNQLRKILLDSSAMSAGDGAIGFLAEVLANDHGQVHETTKDLFIAYAAFAEHPGPIALEGVTTLISKVDSQPEYLLAASGLAHQYCRLANPNCGANEQYQNLVNTIAQRVSVATEEEQIEKVVVALQALGNVDSLTPTAVTSIVNLIEDSHTNERLKVRALDAGRRDPCQETLKKKAAKIFSDIQESSQVRIQAYLTFSKCLTPDDVTVVQSVVNNDEESNQVGAFVVSHVLNVLESSNPDKVAQRKVFELITLRDFPSDVRKFSRNYEVSAFEPSFMNSGLSLDSNVIFSQDSYIPRCTNSNFTIAAFGRSYNLLELGLCVEDFEDVVEKLLGPTSKIRSVTLDDIVRESADKIGKLRTSLSNRFKRDVAVTVHEAEIDAIRNEVDIHERTGSNGNCDIYVRILGTSILVESFSQSGMRRQPLVARIQRAVENLAKGVREQNIDVTEPFMFMDDEIILPTSSGLPITVTTEGTSVLSLQITGNLDVVSLLRGNNGDMKAKIIPSAATVVRAKMVLGSGPIESGLQVEGKIHSAAGVDLKVVRENHKLELRVNMPQERIQVIDVRSDIYWVEQQVDQLEKKTPMKTKLASKSLIDNQCSSSLTKIVGLKVCADVKVPQSSSSAPLFFLNGPSVLSVSVEKIDPSMEGYYLKVESIHDADTYGLDLLLDTPGSRTNRKISAQARAIAPSSATPKYSLKIESPLSNVEVNYKRSFTDELVGAELKFAVDGSAYTGVAEVRKVTEAAGYKLIPLVQYQLPNGNPVKLVEGEITRIPGKKLNVDLKTGGPFRAIRGSIKGVAVVSHNEAGNVEIEYKDLELASEALGKVLLEGKYKRHGKLVDFSVNSRYGQDAQHTLSLDAKVGSPAPRQKVAKISARSSRREFLNFDLDWSLKRDDNSIDHKFLYTRGLTEPKVVIKHESEIKIVSRKEFDVESELTIKHPAYQIDFHAEAEAKSVPGQERSAKLEARLGDNLKAKATYEGSGAFLSNYKILGNLVLADKTYEISEVATKVDDHKKNYKSRISVTPGFYYEANTDLFLKYEKGYLKSELSTEVTSDQLEHPIILKSNVVAKTDGYGALLKLDAHGKNYVDLETTHQVSKAAGSPSSYATKMKAFVLNVVDAKLSNTYSNGNGDLILDALLSKSGRKIAGTSKLQRNGETYNLKADLKWDAERDPSKAITLTSATTLSYSELRIDSQNDITIVGKTAKVNVRGALPRDLLNGESSGEIDYTSPSGKTYSASSKVALEKKTSARAGKIYLRVAPPDVQPSDIEIGLRVSNLNSEERTFDAVADLKANYRNEKDLKVQGELSSLLPGNYRSYAGRLSADGSAIPKPLAVSLKTDIKSGRIAIKGESTSPVKSSLDATVDFDYWSKKKTVGIKYAITTPIDRIQSLEGEIKGGYLRNSIRNFEISHFVSLTLNGGSPYSSKYLFSVLENEAKYEHKLVSAGKDIVTVTADGKLERRHLRGNFNSDVRGIVSKLNLDVEHELPNIAITLKGESNIADGVKNFELKASNKKAADGTLDTEILARVDDDDKFLVRNKLELTPARKSIDAQLILGDDAPRKLFLLFNEEQRGKWNVEALVKWGEDTKYLNTKGSLSTLGGAIEGELTLDSPYLKANKYSVKVTKSLTDGKHGLDITVDGNNQRQIAIALTYGTKTDSSYERSYEGTLKVEGQAVGRAIDFNGKFRLDNTKLDRQRDDGEEGRRIRAALEINANNQPVKLNFLAKRSNKENRLQVSYCKDIEGECRIGNIQLKHLHGDTGELDYELRITAEKAIGGNSKETNGILFRSRLDKNTRQFEHVGKLIISEEKEEQIGYRLYCSPDAKETGGEILLPARVIALVVTGDKTSDGAYHSEIAFYIDKTKKADRKISLLFNIGEKTTTDDHAGGRTLEAIFRHPDLGKDLKVQTRYAIGGDATLLELETILDVLQAGNEIVATYTLSKQVVADARSYTSVLSVKSTGLHINFGANGELKYANRELNYKSVITYENRNNEVKTSQVVLGVSRQRFNFEIEGPSATKIVSFISAYQSTPTGGEIRYEVILPGMEDTRIVRAIANTVSPRNVQLRITTSSNSDAEYVEAFLGFRNNDELAAGIYDNRVDGRHVLGDVTLGMNGTRILSVKSDWSKDNSRAVLTRAQQRAEKHRERLREVLGNAIEEIAQEARHVSSNIRSAIPNLEPVRAATRQQLQELKQELEQNGDTKMILMRIRMAGAYLRQFARIVFELVRTARRIGAAYLGGLRESLHNLPEKYSELLNRVPECIEKLKQLAKQGVEAFINGSRVAAKVLLEAAKNFYEALPPFADVWNWIVDHTECTVKALSEFALKVSEKLAHIYSSLRELANRIMTNKTLQALLAELRNKLQALLEEFIEDTKEQLETVKNFILNAVPQKEFQQFVEALADYIQKKAQKVAVDDAAALRDIYTKLSATIQKVLADVFTVDLKQGIFRAQIPLPVSLKGLSEFSKVFTLPSRPKINFRIPSYTYGLRELINQIRSGAAFNEILPPFKGYALLIGSKYYKTFDGRFFEFEGNCQYLLASDFDDSNFTVVVDYDRQGDVSQKSIIFTDSENTVAIKPDHSVVVNGQPTTLDNAKEAGSLLIESIGGWVVVRSKKGAIVGCSGSQDVCVAKFDGFYHGKVLGLLGTMNLEKFDDLRKPDGEITPSVEQFAASWKLDKQCVEPMIITTMIQATQSAEEKCKAALDNRRSSLRPCYGVVDPTPYRNVCEKLSQKPGYTEEKAVCTASVGYAKACYLEYAKVDAAPACAAA